MNNLDQFGQSGATLSARREGRPAGISRGEKYSDAREHAAEAVWLYVEESIGHKTIARRLGISPRIARIILIESGCYQPGKLKPGFDGSQRQEWDTNEARHIAMCARAWVKEAKAFLRTAPQVTLRAKKSPTEGMTEAERFRWRYRNDPAFHALQLCRRRMKKVIHEGCKSGRSIELVGCSSEHLRAWIESHWLKGMHWGNTGTGAGKWHIDHSVPCSSFDLTKPEHQRQCFHYTNLKPMWSLDNLAKSDRILSATQMSLTMPGL